MLQLLTTMLGQMIDGDLIKSKQQTDGERLMTYRVERDILQQHKQLYSDFDTQAYDLVLSDD